MYVSKIHKKPLLIRQQLQGVFVHRETGSKRGGGEPALHHGLLELCISRPQLEVESEQSAT